MSYQKARALLNSARGACIDEKPVVADCMIESAIEFLDALQTQYQLAKSVLDNAIFYGGPFYEGNRTLVEICVDVDAYDAWRRSKDSK